MLCLVKRPGSMAAMTEFNSVDEIEKQFGSELTYENFDSADGGLCAIDKPATCRDGVINMEFEGTLLYGLVVFINYVNGILRDLSSEQLSRISRYTPICA